MTTARAIGGYFGDPWPSGICDDGTRFPTPVGEPCVECEEPIEEHDQGSFMGNGVWPDRPALVPVHKECGFRAVMGGIGHFEDHERWCIREGDTDGGRTRRQSSLEVWERIVVRR